MNVVFVEPAFPDNQRQFVRALAEVGATVIGVGERPGDWLDEELRGWMAHYHQVPNVVDVGVLTDTVRWIPLDEIEGLIAEGKIIGAGSVAPLYKLLLARAEGKLRAQDA